MCRYRFSFIVMMVGVLVSGCTPSAKSLGFTKNEWRSMPAHKRQVILSEYEKKQTIPVEMVPDSVPKILKFNALRLTLSDGSAIFWPGKIRRSFASMTFKINEGQCRKIYLTSNDMKHKTNLSVCYNHFRLTLDPSPWALKYRDGSAIFFPSELWRQGLGYHSLHTHGKAGLKDFSLYIKVD